MKHSISIAFGLAAALCIFGCAKVEKTGANDANKRYFEAWLHINHPDVQPTGLGIYVLESKEGTGATIGEEGCAFVDFTSRDLEGNITNYSEKITAKQMGTYDTTTFYGPEKWFMAEGVLQAGIRNALIGMKVGGYKKIIVPSWLMTYKTYETPEEYLENSSDASPAIYDLHVRDFTDSIYNWETEQIAKYLEENQDIYQGLTVRDSLRRGFYYKELVPPTVSDTLKADTTVYVNYTGRLLSGLVFDTTLEKVAKDNGLYTTSKKYKPVPVKVTADYSNITLSGSSVIDGFALTIKQMSDNEKGVGIFWSPLGYKTSGSGSSIPGYAPLVFEIELVAKPED